MKIPFQSLSCNQNVLFPSPILDRIASNHPALLVNQVVDELNLDKLFSTYHNRGASSYHPRMLLKVLFYAYLCKIYSCGKESPKL